MSNPLLDKFQEVYGGKPETTEEITEETAEEVPDYVIPTAQVTSTGINLTGNYVHPNNLLISNGNINSLNVYTKTISIPYQTNIEHQFYKVMEDVSRGKGVIAEIKAEVDPTFTGFGGQIKYTVEILAHYP